MKEQEQVALEQIALSFQGRCYSQTDEALAFCRSLQDRGYLTAEAINPDRSRTFAITAEGLRAIGVTVH